MRSYDVTLVLYRLECLRREYATTFAADDDEHCALLEREYDELIGRLPTSTQPYERGRIARYVGKSEEAVQ